MVEKDEILEEMEPCEPYTAGDLADELGEPRRTIDHKLRQLAENNKVNRKKHSTRRVTWWVHPDTDNL